MFFGSGRSGFRTFGEWVFCIFVALFPFVIYQGYLFYGTATRAVNLLIFVELFAILFGCALFSSKERLSVALSPITGCLALLLVVLFISAFQGVDMSMSFWSQATRTTGLFYFLHIGLFYLFLFFLFAEEKKLRRLIEVILVSAGVFSIGAFLSKDGLGVFFQSKPWNGFTFGNSTFAAMYIYAAFMLSVYYCVSIPKEKRSWWKNLLPLVFVINPYILNRELLIGKINLLQHPFGFIGEAQASSYVILFSTALLLGMRLVSKLKNPTVRKGFLWGSVATGIVVFLIGLHSFMSVGGYLQEAYLKQSSNARPIIWELSKNSIHDRSLLGWGIDNFDRALEAHYNNHLLEEKNGAEPWFDRAHNVFIDQTVDTGYLGMAVYLLVYATIIGCMLFVLLRSKEKNDQRFGAVLLVYFIGHFLELQTAFDTTISYVPLAIMTGCAAILFHRTYKALNGPRNEKLLPQGVQYGIGVLIIGASLWALFAGGLPIARAENANGAIRNIGSSEKRLPLYPALFGSPLDRASFLWRTSMDLQRGIALTPEIIGDPKKRDGFVKELDVYAGYYKEYLATHEDDYRAQINLAELYIYERLLDVDHLEEAHAVLDKAIALVPQAPQAYWMKAVAYLYQRKFDLAKEWAKKAYDLNPKVEESTRVLEYINHSVKTFPEIDFYFFKQN